MGLRTSGCCCDCPGWDRFFDIAGTPRDIEVADAVFGGSPIILPYIAKATFTDHCYYKWCTGFGCAPTGAGVTTFVFGSFAGGIISCRAIYCTFTGGGGGNPFADAYTAGNAAAWDALGTIGFGACPGDPDYSGCVGTPFVESTFRAGSPITLACRQGADALTTTAQVL